VIRLAEPPDQKPAAKRCDVFESLEYSMSAGEVGGSCWMRNELVWPAPLEPGR